MACCNSGGQNIRSRFVTRAGTAGAPATISDLSAAAGEAKLDLSWSAPGGNGAAVTGYDVHYTSAPETGQGSVGDNADASGNDASAAWVDASHSGTTASHTITGLAGGTEYRVRVRAVNSRGNAGWAHGTGTPEAPAVTDPPAAPTGLGVTPGNAQLELEWTAPAGAASYDVHYTSSTSVAAGAAVQTGASATAANGWVDASHTGATASHTITGLTNTTPYRVRVRGVNAAGDGAWAWGNGTPKASTTGSTDASLSALVLKDFFDGTLDFTETFSATKYAYVANVGAAEDLATVTPTVNESNATVKVNGTAVTSGSASGEIDLAFGATTITVEVTAQAGNTRNYTITVNRALPTVRWSSSTLSLDEVSSGNPEWLVSASNTISGTVTYAPGATNPASLTDDLGSGRTTAFTMSPGDTYLTPRTPSAGVTDDSDNEEHETFTITIDAGTGYTVGSPATITLTITDDDPPAAPGSLSVARGNAKLTASWTKPAGPVTKYQVRWKETSATDQTATTTGDPSTGWVAGSELASSSLSQEITSLTNDTSYDVQVRATDGQTETGNGWGAWSSSQSETPKAKTYGFQFTSASGRPGGAINIVIELSEAAPTGGLELTLTQLLGSDNVPTGLCTGSAYAESDDIESNQPTSVTVAAGETTADIDYRSADNGDDLVGVDTECFALRLGTSATGWTAAAGKDVVKMSIGVATGAVAFGSAASLVRDVASSHAATVAENVTGGTLSVPVTVSHLPKNSKTITVRVDAAGTATEWASAQNPGDFRIETKSVTFGPATAKTQNLTVTINDDTEVEHDETIVLRFASTSDSYRARDRAGRATLTIESEDAVPGAVGSLGVAAGDTLLRVTWTAPADTGSAAVTGYDVHYTSAPSTGDGSVGDDAASSGSDPAVAWVDAGHTGTTAGDTIGGLTNGTAYRVRVRAANEAGAGAWEHVTGTPGAKTYGFSVAGHTVGPGATLRLDITLSEAAPAGGLELTVTQLLGTNVPSGLCGSTALATAADIGSSPPTSVTVAGGATTATISYPIADNGDDLVGGGECFAVRLGTSASGWSAGAAVARVTISHLQGRIAMGTAAASTAKYTVSVAETVSGGTLLVPVTVDHLPASATTFSVAVLSGGTATEWVSAQSPGDFRIQTKSVEFGPATAKTLNLTVTITNDAAVESDETIELGIVAAPNNDPTHNQAYVRDAQGRLAQVTITSEDAVPGVVPTLEVTADSARLVLAWTAPAAGSSAITGYDVHYTSATAAAVPDDAAASGSNAATAWVDAGHTGTTGSQTLASLVNDRTYRVRVRAVNASGAGGWKWETGTPQAGPSSNANLSALVATSTSGSGYTALALDPAFQEATTSYTAAAANAATHVKLRPTAAHAAASVTVNGAAVTSGQESAAIALGSTARTITVRVTAEDGTTKDYTVTASRRSAVTLGASPNPVPEGSDVTVTATLSPPPAADVTIPLTVTPGTAEDGDHGTLASITVAAGAATGTGTITTHEDDDLDDETFTVALGTLPSTVEAGTPSSVEVRIADVPAVSLEASPEEVVEGESVTVTARVSIAQPGAVTIPLVVTRGTSESGDHGTLRSIRIASGETAGTGTIATREDADLENETFTVALGGPLPSPLVEGSPSEVQVVIVDDDTLKVALASSTSRPREGASARLTATLSHPAPEGGVTLWFIADGSGDNPAAPITDFTLAPAAEGQNVTNPIEIAEGQRTARGWLRVVNDTEPEDDEGVVVGFGTTAVLPEYPELELTIPANDGGGGSGTVATIDAAPNPVEEGREVEIGVWLSNAPDADVTIPLTVTRGTSEEGDHGTLDEVVVAAGGKLGVGRIATTRDDDSDDETFTVRFGTLPEGVRAGSPSRVEVVIEDTDAPRVWLEAEPNPVEEGDPVTVTAVLSAPLDGAVTIPVSVERGTSEPGDHGSLSGIRIASGATEGTGTITTSVDSDTDDETFVVRLRPNQPAGVGVGDPDAVEVTITDGGGGAPGRVRSLRVAAGHERLNLTWSPPSSGTPTAYEAEYRKRGASGWTAVGEGDYTDTEAVILGLENGTAYDVRVRAENAQGSGPWATGSGTPRTTSGRLTSLTVTASATRDGTYAAATLSPSFRSSATDYTAALPVAAGTHPVYVRFRPRSADGEDVLVAGNVVASGSESGPIETGHGSVIAIQVFDGDGTPNHYRVKMSVPQASMDAGRTVTAAVDAALAAVGELSPEDAASALLGERSLADERLEALDRLGNDNGRYDVGDLLAWIERCRNGGATCGEAPRTPPPASDAALPAAAAAAMGGGAARRPRRRPPGRRRPGRRQKLRGLAVLLAAALWSCDGAGVLGPPAGTVVPDPGLLTVEWTAPAGGPMAAGALVEIDGPGFGEVRAPGLELYGSGEGNGPRRFVIAGGVGDGAVLEFRVPDRNLAGLYSVRVVEVAGQDHRLLDTDRYRAAITPH